MTDRSRSRTRLLALSLAVLLLLLVLLGGRCGGYPSGELLRLRAAPAARQVPAQAGPASTEGQVSPWSREAGERGGTRSIVASPRSGPVRSRSLPWKGSLQGDSEGPPPESRAALPPDVQTAIPDLDAAPAPEGVAGAEAVLLEVQLGRLARRVLKGYWVGDDVLLPVRGWLDFAEVRHEGTASLITGRLEPGRVHFVVEADSGFVRSGRQVLAAQGRELEVIGGEVYASRRLISEWLGLSTAVDREAATLSVYNPENLPVARRLRRESARAIHVGGEARLPAEQIHRPEDRARTGLILGYEVRGSSHNPEQTAAYDVGLATSLAGGSILLRTRGAGNMPPQFEGAWSKMWPLQRWLTQLRLGDGSSNGPRPYPSRGVSITNEPIARTLLVEDLPFAGTLPPDWSVEAYRAGQLVGFDSVGASGRYALTLPIQYGENPVDFIAYGPFGEVRTFNRTFRALPSMLGPGALEYGVAGGECRDPRCRATANVGLRYGISKRWTVRAGMDRFWRDGRGSLSHEYAGVVGAPTNAFGIELEGVTKLLRRAGVRFEPSAGLRLNADYIAYADSGTGSPFLPLGTREQWSVYGRYLPGSRRGRFLLEGQGTRTLTTAGLRSEARAGVAVHVANMVLRPYARGERVSSESVTERGFLGLDATILPRRELGVLLGGFWVQGQVEVEAGRSLTSAGATAARNLGPGFRIEGGARWDRTLPGPTFTLSIVSQLQAVRSTSVLTAPSGGERARIDQSVGGSILWSPSGGPPGFSSDPALDRGGIGGRVFLDLDANGAWEENEPPLPGTRLLVANRWVVSGADGRYRVWGLSPHEEVMVSVDTTSLASPWWMPAFAATALLPAPNLIRDADVPVLIGGVVEGMLITDGRSAQPVSRPLTVELTELGSGTRMNVESFTDGTFYRMGLRPGRYQATVAAAGQGLVSDTVRFELHPGSSASDPGPSVSGLRLTLRKPPRES